MFTQQHYETLAEVLRDTRLDLSARLATTDKASVESLVLRSKKEGIDELQLRLQNFLKKDNPKFKELLFIGAASEHSPTTRK
jgi:hypothetical protein